MTDRKTIAERADQSVRWTGIPALVMAPASRRPLRWWPAAALSIATLGIAVALAGGRYAPFGQPLIFVGLAIGGIARARGPLVGFAGPETPDERETALFHRAYAFGGFVMGVVAPLALVGLAAGAIAADWTRDMLAHALMAAGFYAMAVWSTLPTLYASWLVRPLGDDA